MVKNLIKQLNKSEFLKNALMLITGTVIAQFIPILLQPILRRMFTPEDFGTFAVYTSLLGIVVSIANLRYESTVMLPQKDSDAANLVVAGGVISFLMAALSGVVLLIFGEAIISFFDLDPQLLWLFYFLPISIFFFSAYQSMNYYLIRKKAFRMSSLNKVIRRGGEGSTQIGVGIYFSSIGLIIGTIAGDVLNFSSGIFQLRRKGFKRKWVKYVKILALLKRYKDFPLYNAVPALLNTLSLTLPVLIITKFYGEEVTGYFDLSRMVLALPLALVSVSVSQVVFQTISEKIRNRQSIIEVIKKTTVGLGAVAVIMVVVGIFFSVPVFTFVFGEQWELSGSMTQILIASYALKFVVSPLSITFNALEKIRLSSSWQLLYFLSILLLLFFKDEPIETFLNYYLIIDLIAYTIYYLLMIVQVTSYEKSLNETR